MLNRVIPLREDDPSVTLTAYCADEAYCARDAVLVIPGGAYYGVCADREGEPIALAFLARGVNAFVLEPLTDMAYIAEKYGKTHAFIGNADTRILLSGTKDEIEAEVKRCFDIGKKCPGFIMAVGNHIPSNTPVENALWYNECYEKMKRR